jgi:hypothetical protein
MKTLQTEINELAYQEKTLDEHIEQVQKTLKNMTESDEYQKRAFVTYADIRNIPSLRDRTVIAIRAPAGTTLTVPDPDDVSLFALFNNDREWSIQRVDSKSICSRQVHPLKYIYYLEMNKHNNKEK